MRPIDRHFNNTVTIQRLVDVEYTDRETYATLASGVKCMIQPLDDGNTEDLTGRHGKNYYMFCAQSVDIDENDRVTDENGAVYYVVGVKDFRTWLGIVTHREVTLRAFLP